MTDTTTELLVWTEAEIKKISELVPSQFKFPQEIIHIKHYISWQQYKYWAFLLQELWQQLAAHVQPDEKGFYSMPMKKMAEFIGYMPKKSKIWNDLKAIKNETLTFNVLNKDKEQEKYGAGFISEWRVSNSYIRFKFPSMLEDIMRKLEEPESKAMFSWLCTEILDHFSGKYAAVIYKLCKDYAGVGRTPRMALKEFREYMGIKEFEYPEFKKLNARVIAEPVKRINDSEVSDIRVIPEFDRPDRRVVWLYFRIEYKKQTVLPLSISEEDNAFQAAKIPIAQKIQDKYRAIRPANEIELCIERANDYGQQQEMQGKSVSYGRLYAAAIKEGWHEEKLNAKNKEAEKQAKRKAEQDAEAEREKADAAKFQYAKDAKARAWEKFNSLPDNEQWTVQTMYLNQATEPEIAVFRKLGIDSPAFRIYLVTALTGQE